MNLESYLVWYQERIGLYDKQSWETTVEQRILRGLSYSPRKTAKQKTDLIDVDLVRGSTFPKAKPKSDVWLAGLHGIIRILFLPFYIRWWIKETTYIGAIFVVSMYCSLIVSCLIFFTFYECDEIKIVPGFEVLLPVAILFLLSIIYSQMACTRRKGIKLAFRERYGRNIRSGRKHRTSRNNSLGSGLNSSYVSENDNRNCKSIKHFDSSHRSHSEDLQSSHALEFDNRSASESNLALKGKVEELPVTEGNEKNAVIQANNLTKCPQNEEVKNSDSECNLRYRGYSNRGYKFTNSADYPQRNCLGGYINNRFEKSSDDGEEGCHADCEGPSTDEEEGMQRERKSKLKLGSNMLLHRRSISPQKQILVPKSDLNLPTVIVQHDDGSLSSCDSDGEVERGPSYHPSSLNRPKPLLGDWIGITTNSEDPSYSSESEAGWGDDLAESGQRVLHREPIDWHIQGAPAAVISSTTKDVDKVGCKIWEGAEMKKVDLSVLDIASAIISRVDSLHQSSSYLMFGLVMAVFLSLVPMLFRFGMMLEHPTTDIHERINGTESHIVYDVVGDNCWCSLLIILNAVNRLILASCFFFLLSVAERTFKQRFLYAKHFCYLTSARRARKYEVPHFRLNKVINIKSWLSIRSCLKKRGPQHSVDVIISATFIVTLLLVFYLGVEALKDEERATQPLHNCELFVWCFAVSIYLIRFMTLGALINKKYSNPSVLITEQINMYLHMEQNPQKKDNLMLANNVLKLVSVLLKELDSPFKISGLSANTLLYNITKFGILSACSGVLSNLLGFKLKLHNIKFR